MTRGLTNHGRAKAVPKRLERFDVLPRIFGEGAEGGEPLIDIQAHCGDSLRISIRRWNRLSVVVILRPQVRLGG